MPHDTTTIRPAKENDTALILSFIHGLAEYEKLAHEVIASEADLRRTLFGEQPSAEALIAEYAGKPAGFAIFFTSYSTFLAQPAISKTCLSCRNFVVGVLAKHCWHFLLVWLSSAEWGGWTGRCWTGMNRQSNFMNKSVPRTDRLDAIPA